MLIHTIDTAEQFFSLRREWNTLLQSSGSDGVFLTHEWLSCWWKHLSEGRQLSILTARDDGRLIGILPVGERRPQYTRMMPRVLEFLGSGLIGSDYLDVIAKTGREDEVCAAFAEHIQYRGLMLQLSQLRGGFCTAGRFAAALQRHQWTFNDTKLNVCPYIDLRGLTWDDFVGNLGPNVRKNLNRYLRILPKHFQLRVECVTEPSETERAIDIVVRLHEKRWGTRGTSEAFQTPAVVAFHREFVRFAAERGWLRILILWLDDAPAACLYGLRYGPTFYFYQSGFDPDFGKYSVGVATMGLAIKTAIEEGAGEYDFLHGNEEYKFHWASAVREIRRLELYPPHTRARIYRQAIHFNRAARRMARRVLEKAR